jgi:hypothetical protein
MDLVLSMKFITLGVGTAGSLAVVRRQRQEHPVATSFSCRYRSYKFPTG